MKIKIILIALLLSLMSFGQDREYENANSNYKNHNYTEAIAIGEKILQNQYGSVSPLLKLYTTFLVADSYKLLNKYPEAIKRYKEYLELIKNSSLFNDKIKEEATVDIQKGVDEMQSKIVITEKTPSIPQIQPIEKGTINSETETVLNPVAKTTDTDKTVTLTVSSSGKTIEEAKNNALRSAIEQAFGTFISSKTEIFNNIIVKDEIVSVANGNIKNFDIVSQVEIPGNGFGVTINATVSIDKLTSFAESKGIEIEFKGGLFAQNIKLQKINEQSELNACVNLYSVVHELLQKAFDYTVENEDPKLVKDDLYSIKFTVKVKPNANYFNAIEYFINSLQKIAMSSEEVEVYQKLNKGVFEFIGFKLRNELSRETLVNIMTSYGYYLGNFKITINENNIIFGPDQGYELSKNSIPRDIVMPSYIFPYYSESCSGDSIEYVFLSIGNSDIKTDDCWIPYYEKNNSNFIYEWEQQFNLSEIEKMQKINVASRGVRSKFKYGGYVIYDDGSKMIIAAPYKCNYKVDDLEYRKRITVQTSEKLFDGKTNMELLKNDNSTFFELISKLNVKNNTDWIIPTAHELKLYVKEVYGNMKNIILLSSSVKSDEIWEYIQHWKTQGDYEHDIKINEKSKFFFNDGRPFNSQDAFEIINGLDPRAVFNKNTRTRYFMPLIKYITLK